MSAVIEQIIERLHEEEDGERLVLRFIGPDRKSSQSTLIVALLQVGHLLAREVVFKWKTQSDCALQVGGSFLAGYQGEPYQPLCAQ